MAPWRLGVASCGRSPSSAGHVSLGRTAEAGGQVVMGVAGWSSVACGGRPGPASQQTIHTPHQQVISSEPCRPCELAGRALLDNTTDIRVARMHGVLGHCSAALGYSVRGKNATHAEHNKQVCSRMDREAKRRNRGLVAMNTSVPKVPTRLASRMVRARLLTAAVSTEVKHIVRAPCPLRRGSAGALLRGVAPLYLATLPRDSAEALCTFREFD